MSRGRVHVSPKDALPPGPPEPDVSARSGTREALRRGLLAIGVDVKRIIISCLVAVVAFTLGTLTAVASPAGVHAAQPVYKDNPSDVGATGSMALG